MRGQHQTACLTLTDELRYQHYKRRNKQFQRALRERWCRREELGGRGREEDEKKKIRERRWDGGDEEKESEERG